MEITKDLLDDYSNMVGYAKDLERKVKRLAKEIDTLEKRLVQIESGEQVMDKVSGGEGGIQHFTITGVPTKEYHEKKNRLYLKKMSYNQLYPLYQEQIEHLNTMIVEIENFIAEIDDISVKRIINLRYIENLTWNEVADAMGGGNSEDSVKKAFYRYMENLS